VICFEPSDHFGDSEFVSPECKPKSLVTLTPESRKELLSEEFWDFGNSGFRIPNLDDKEPGAFALKNPGVAKREIL
jgi:hypothetical protein